MRARGWFRVRVSVRVRVRARINVRVEVRVRVEEMRRSGQLVEAAGIVSQCFLVPAADTAVRPVILKVTLLSQINSRYRLYKMHHMSHEKPSRALNCHLAKNLREVE